MRGRFLAATLIGWSLAAGGAARAQLFADLAPSVGGGATDNATLTANGVTPTSDAFGTVGGSALLHYEMPRASHALAYRFMLTHYVAVDVPVSDGLSNGLSWVSSFNPTARLSFQITHATDSDTNAERDYIVAELIKSRSIETVKVYQSGQGLPGERINHYITNGEIMLASLLVDIEVGLAARDMSG